MRFVRYGNDRTHVVTQHRCGYKQAGQAPSAVTEHPELKKFPDVLVGSFGHMTFTWGLQWCVHAMKCHVHEEGNFLQEANTVEYVTYRWVIRAFQAQHVTWSHSNNSEKRREIPSKNNQIEQKQIKISKHRHTGSEWDSITRTASLPSTSVENEPLRAGGADRSCSTVLLDKSTKAPQPKQSAERNIRQRKRDCALFLDSLRWGWGDNGVCDGHNLNSCATYTETILGCAKLSTLETTWVMVCAKRDITQWQSKEKSLFEKTPSRSYVANIWHEGGLPRATFKFAWFWCLSNTTVRPVPNKKNHCNYRWKKNFKSPWNTTVNRKFQSSTLFVMSLCIYVWKQV